MILVITKIAFNLAIIQHQIILLNFHFNKINQSKVVNWSQITIITNWMTNTKMLMLAIKIIIFNKLKIILKLQMKKIKLSRVILRIIYFHLIDIVEKLFSNVLIYVIHMCFNLTKNKKLL